MLDMYAKRDIMVALVVASFIIGAVLWNYMPDRMASHWDIEGKVNGYSSKLVGLFLIPFTSMLLFLMYLAIPRIDPLRRNIAKFRPFFDTFMLVVMAFLIYIYLFTLAWNLGFRFNLTQVMVPGIAGLFYYSGILLENSRRNWFIGIRTPWTISSEKVWNRTHKLGAGLFKASAIISLAGIVFPSFAAWLLLGPVLASSVYLIAYSYVEYSRLHRKRR